MGAWSNDWTGATFHPSGYCGYCLADMHDQDQVYGFNGQRRPIPPGTAGFPLTHKPECTRPQAGVSDAA